MVKPQDNIIMVIKHRVSLVSLLVVTQVETHVEERVVIPRIYFHLGNWETIHKPVDGIVLLDSVINEFSLFSSDIGHKTECLARSILLQHFDLVAHK